MEPARPADELAPGGGPEVAVRNASGRRGFFVLLVLIGVLCSTATLRVAKLRDCLYNPDEAAYAEQADALYGGRPLTAGFVRHFHVRHPPDIVHPEDFYPPGNGALLALAWAALGRSDFASTVPSILIACLLLPILAWFLARRLGASPAFAFAAGVAVALEPNVRALVYQGLADLPLAACFTGAVLLALRATRTAAIGAGALVALGFWFKPTALLFVPAIAAVLAIASRQGLARRAVCVALSGAATLALIAPWLWRNHELFGDPLYSGNKHLTAAASAPDFQYEHIRKVYWADPATPDGPVAAATSAWTVLTRFLLHCYECAVVHGPAVFGLWFLLAALVLLRHREGLAVLAAIGGFLLALCAVFAIDPRYLLPVVPAIAAVAWSFADRVVRAIDVAAVVRGTPFEALARFGGRLGGGRLAPASWLALLLAATATLPGSLELARDVVRGKRLFTTSGDRAQRDAALWARDHLPADARVLTHEALRFRHYSRLLTVNTPFDAPDRIQAVVDAYSIGYVVTTAGGDFAELGSRYLEPWLVEHGGEWTELRPPAGPFRVLWRNGFAAPH